MIDFSDKTLIFPTINGMAWYNGAEYWRGLTW